MVGYDWGAASVHSPIVVGAIIDDLAVGDGRLRPDPESAYKACAAVSAAPSAEGNVGAGAGGVIGEQAGKIVGRSAPRRRRRVRGYGGHPEEKPGSREAARARPQRPPRAAQPDARR